jgi:hypothetical protein
MLFAMLLQPDTLFIQFIEKQGLYMFQALLDHSQEALHKRHFVYCSKLQPCHSQLTYARNIRNVPNAICAANPEDEKLMLEICRGP